MATSRRIYGATDVFVLTSRNEGTPVALIEAMAAAIASVSTDVGGVRDVMTGPEAGLARAVRRRVGPGRRGHAVRRVADAAGRVGSAAREPVRAGSVLGAVARRHLPG